MSNQKESHVNCPICGKTMAAAEINAHLDANCQAATGTATTRSVQSHLNMGGKVTPNTKETKPASETRMAPLFQLKSPQATQPKRPSTNPSSFKKEDHAIATSSTPLKRQKREAAQEAMPLAAKVRPLSLSEFVGQEELVGEHGVLRPLMESDRIPSMILWGPPGCGKTTMARIISKTTKARFVELSATSHGSSDVRKVFEEAKGHLMLTNQRTIVFIDEIHRFNKAQQDLLLPFVEQGIVHLIGATTENPSFKVNSALLSRCRVFVLKQHTEDDLLEILKRALGRWRQDNKTEDSTAAPLTDTESEALRTLAIFSDGDARNALNTLEIALSLLPNKESPLLVETVKGAFQKSHLLYDRNGEQHYNIISALHKSIRGSDADAALYWLGRMLEAGEDPLYIARRLVRCASEDIGLADNTALPLAMAAYNACEKIGMPECDTILAHLVVHLAETKKSVRSYKAYNLVKSVIRQEPNYPVPLHIRNAPTTLMKGLGYGAGYKYNPDYEEPVEQTYLPDALQGRKFLDAEKES
ncbi:putative AAA family ATPase [Radiomyces spectabilis]|uniref:putative AAA family ATPase n=1 Tax=Radiomyces spectabilis TaxID=64574 RepID=UPI0022200098|nr:putative AAA family ATPase [Radiomyces spectabilis]KAI8379318.1 putative AAA family ATPase [Radiomyces spectabilis]